MSTLFATNQNFTVNSTYGIYYHNLRLGKKYEKYNSEENIFLISPTQSYYNSVKGALADKSIKNNFKPKQSKPLSEILVRAIGEDFYDVLSKEQQIRFFKDSLAFVSNKVGKENILSAVIHYDEEKRLPHIHITYIPIITIKEPILKKDKNTGLEVIQTRELSGRKLWVENDNAKEWKKGYNNFQDDIAKYLIEDKDYGTFGLTKATGITNKRPKLSAEDFKKITNWEENKKLAIEKENETQKSSTNVREIKTLEFEISREKQKIKTPLGKYDPRVSESIFEKQKEIIRTQESMLIAKDNLINNMVNTKGINKDTLKSQYDKLSVDYSNMSIRYNKLRTEHKSLQATFNTLRNSFNNLCKLITHSPIIEKANDILHNFIKSFSKAETYNTLDEINEKVKANYELNLDQSNEEEEEAEM